MRLTPEVFLSRYLAQLHFGASSSGSRAPLGSEVKKRETWQWPNSQGDLQSNESRSLLRARTEQRLGSRRAASGARLKPDVKCLLTPGELRVTSEPAGRGKILESRVVPEKRKFDGADRAVTLLADDDFRGALVG